MMDLEQYRQEAENNPYLRLNHIQIKKIEKDYAELAVMLMPELKNPYGKAHGGLFYTMSDCCAGIAARTDGRKYVTLDTSFHYLQNVDDGVLCAKSFLIRRGRHVCVVEVVITDEEDHTLTEGVFTMYCVTEAE